MGNHRESGDEPRGDATSSILFRDQGERQDGDCGPAAGIGTLYYIYCKTGVKRAELESLLTYRAIRQFAMTHLQRQTILTAAQVDDTQMVGCQEEVHKATQDLRTQVTPWVADTDPYASTAAWVWEQIAQPESLKHKQTSNMLVGLGSGTSNQSSVTASPRRPLNQYAGSGSGAKYQNHIGRGVIRFNVTLRYT